MPAFATKLAFFVMSVSAGFEVEYDVTNRSVTGESLTWMKLWSLSPPSTSNAVDA